MAIATPRDRGFFMPAEWAPHRRCWMAWPCREETFPGTLAEARAATAAVARAIAAFEPVAMAARPRDAAEARRTLGEAATVVEMPLSDSWIRDSGPSFLVDGQGGLAGVDWGFNAWGMTYTDFAADAAVARRVLDHAGARRFAGPMVLEGGAISVDGEGTLITTRQCLLNGNRNPHLTQGDIETILGEYLGVSTVIWLNEGLENDETDGHVDEIACFAGPGRVLLLDSTDAADPNTATLAENRRLLDAARDARGRRLTVLPLPQPAVRRVGHLGRLSLSYANFHIANGGIVCPAYDDPLDGEARSVLAHAFPDHRVVMVPALALCEGGGNVHCITQQEPRPPR
jgi:agmatine deiminase